MTMHSARRNASNFAFGLAVLSVGGFLLAWTFNWPSTFVLDDTPDSEVSAADVVNGTVTSIPLVPFVLLLVAAVAARSPQRRGTAGTVVLLLLGLVFTMGGLAEVVSDNDSVPRVVLIVAGLLFASLGLSLTALAALALRRRGG